MLHLLRAATQFSSADFHYVLVWSKYTSIGADPIDKQLWDMWLVDGITDKNAVGLQRKEGSYPAGMLRVDFMSW